MKEYMKYMSFIKNVLLWGKITFTPLILENWDKSNQMSLEKNIKLLPILITISDENLFYI